MSGKRYKIISQMRRQALDIFYAALQAVDPLEAVLRRLKIRDDILTIGDKRLVLNDYDQILIVGAGKAAAPMAQAVESLLLERIAKGLIVVKDGHGLSLKKIKVREAGHPVPDERGLDATEKILSIAEKAGPKDLLISLISGGGSALLTAPAEGVSLTDKQEATKLLLVSGAGIHEFNTVRKHLSQVKGGRLACLACPATVVSLVLSDVVGDDLDVIASGPTTPDYSTFLMAKQILKKYKIWDRVASSVRSCILKGINGEIKETPKNDNVAFRRCFQVLIGTNLQALKAAGKHAEHIGYRPLILSSRIEGTARELAGFYAAIAKEIISSHNPLKPPACILAGGETTVIIQGDGKGGRNQEFTLAAALALNGIENVVVFGGGTDGTDGPTNAAGAIADGETVKRACAKGLDPEKYLKQNNSYPFFQILNDLIITGPTRTNVMDLYILLVKT